jgi:hypothetical protein
MYKTKQILIHVYFHSKIHKMHDDLKKHLNMSEDDFFFERYTL